MKPLLLVLALFAGLFLPASWAQPKTYGREITCPIDGQVWKHTWESISRASKNRLDLKRLEISPTWLMPQCPKCRFAFYQAESLPLPLERLKPYILSEAYQTASKGRPPSYCAALIQTFLGGPPFKVGLHYLAASWQTESNPKESREYLDVALTHITAALTSSSISAEEFQIAASLCGELERRTGRFEQARQRCEAYLTRKGFQEEYQQAYLKRILSFVAAKDSAPHALTDADEHLVEGAR